MRSAFACGQPCASASSIAEGWTTSVVPGRRAILRYGVSMRPWRFVDACRGSPRRVDQTDVRAFRRFDRADAAIVRQVNVADFEARAFARQTARPERRHAALVRHFRQRVGLVHELAELRRTEELRAPRATAGLALIRSFGITVDTSTDLIALLHRALHAEQADAILVFPAVRRPSGHGGYRGCRYRRFRPCRPSGSPVP